MRAFSGSALFFVAVLLLTRPAFSRADQVPIGGNLNTYDVLLLNDGVQKELKLTDEQITKVKEVIHDVRVTHRREMEAARDQNDPTARLHELLKNSGAEVFKRLDPILRAAQIKRLKQFKTQQEGLAAFQNSEVAGELHLTDQQKQKIKVLEESLTQQCQNLFEGGERRQYAQSLRKINALKKEVLQKAVLLLTPVQKKAWDELVGEPFEAHLSGPIQRGASGPDGAGRDR